MKKEKQQQEILQSIISVYSTKVLHHHVNASGSLSPGTFFDTDSLKNIFKFVNSIEEFKVNNFSGLVPKNILKYNTDDGSLIFYTPAKMQKMIFTESIGIETGDYKIPYLLWIYTDRSLNIFALKGIPNKENMEVFQAPLLNISDEGLMCMGDVKYTNSTGNFNGFAEILEDLFFNSVFTHTNCNNLATENIHNVYKKAFQNPKFDWSKYLISTKKTLKDVI